MVLLQKPVLMGTAISEKKKKQLKGKMKIKEKQVLITFPSKLPEHLIKYEHKFQIHQY